MRTSSRLAALLVLALLTSFALAAPAHAAATTASFTKTSDWGSGYEGKITINNASSSAIDGWKVEFDLSSGSSVGTYWDALHTKSGDRNTFTHREYNRNIAAGATVSFGFIVSGTATPTNCTINGASCGGGGDPGAPSAPTGLRSTGTTNSSISLSWTASGGSVTGYRVYEGGSVKTTVSGTSATISGLATCSSHTYTVAAYNGSGESAKSAPVSATTSGCTGGGTMKAAPYLYMGWGNPPSPSTVMNATGIKYFTMAFILSSGGCNPAWDGQRPLQGSADATAISQIKAAGGDIIPSIGGWSGNKLGPNCSSAEALAGAYQKVIDAYNLKAIDVDIENTDEFENATVQDRILGALKIVKQNNPGIKTILTFGTTTSGPNSWGNRLIQRAAELNANVDVFTIMPFDFNGGANMYQNTVNASEGLKNSLKTSFGWSDSVAYSRMGISGMNGLSDQQELTSPSTWNQITQWAKSKGLSRLAFWAVNRDRPCPGGGVVSHCSGIDQQQWEFTKITAGF
ncbi:cellulose binding domain-containing protein [Stackebrandtia nassauensis]|uniref:Cellulose-binding family II n=1 Tax=Stackebrandtia nassauensis (strain DSM 44728 / CIP 108903 / NRRL B-16338 / NBRC 102104 / LLR-40K-21) TaxID=446470 RepID=D3Q7B3_STANL|nr:cellulose binding domain-containing protein [Stackebrandtia nassauensis]ADD42384.1 cellulose-binding family II [Stackebrandtia nassauensis DSM 44728]